mmetsp:Transcript_106795/g.341051  ORF Transcript_106795/g.341051 Transcript_106795/m.341051 type:complete len:311 (+) Transcript_106795:3240-4172(+)
MGAAKSRNGTQRTARSDARRCRGVEAGAAHRPRLQATHGHHFDRRSGPPGGDHRPRHLRAGGCAGRPAVLGQHDERAAHIARERRDWCEAHHCAKHCRKDMHRIAAGGSCRGTRALRVHPQWETVPIDLPTRSRQDRQLGVLGWVLEHATVHRGTLPVRPQSCQCITLEPLHRYSQRWVLHLGLLAWLFTVARHRVQTGGVYGGELRSEALYVFTFRHPRQPRGAGAMPQDAVGSRLPLQVHSWILPGWRGLPRMRPWELGSPRIVYTSRLFLCSGCGTLSYGLDRMRRHLARRRLRVRVRNWLRQEGAP